MKKVMTGEYLLAQKNNTNDDFKVVEVAFTDEEDLPSVEEGGGRRKVEGGRWKVEGGQADHSTPVERAPSL